MEFVHEIQEPLKKELQEVHRKAQQNGKLSTEEIKRADTALHALKSARTIEAMEEGGSYGRTGNYRNYNGHDYGREYGRDGYGGYGDSYGAMRSRDSEGRYNGGYRGGNYGDSNRTMMELERLMNEAGSEDERRKIRECMESMR